MALMLHCRCSGVIIMNLNFVENNSSKRFEINVQKNTGTNPATQKIQGALTKASSLSDCLSSIQSITGYLSDESKEVRDMAAKAIVSLVGKAVEFLSKENNPDIIQEASVKLLGVIKQLSQHGSISLGADEKSKLDNCENIIVEKLVNATKDKFINANDKLASNPFNSNGFESSGFKSSLNRAVKNLTGNTTPGKITNLINNSIGNLLGVA